MIFIFFRASFVFWLKMRYVLVNAPYIVEENVHLLFYGVLCKYQLYKVDSIVHVFITIFTLLFCELLRGDSPTIIAVLSISHFTSSFFFTYWFLKLCRYMCTHVGFLCLLNELTHLSLSLSGNITYLTNIHINRATTHFVSFMFDDMSFSNILL